MGVVSGSGVGTALEMFDLVAVTFEFIVSVNLAVETECEDLGTVSCRYLLQMYPNHHPWIHVCWGFLQQYKGPKEKGFRAHPL